MATPRTAVMAEAGSALLAQRVSVRRSSMADPLVVDDVSLSLSPLELHGLVGPGGAGKTTLLEALAGLVPSTGDVVLGHVPLDGHGRRQHIFYVPDLPDAPAPFADDSAAEVLRLAERGLQAGEGARDDVVERLSLRPLLDARMGWLSRGERKRVLVAMALLVPRGFVLLDEPFGGLDVKESRALAAVLRTATHERRGILCALHVFAEAERLCDRFTLLSRGRVVGQGALHELRQRANVHPGVSLEEVFLALA